MPIPPEPEDGGPPPSHSGNCRSDGFRSVGHFTKKAQAAFSLVEIVLAIGVIAFAFVGLLGLLPAGLTNFRKAMDTSIGAQIAQRVVGDLQQADFDTLLTDSGITITNVDSNVQTGTIAHRFFDDQGNEIVLTPTSSTSIKHVPEPSTTDRNKYRIIYDVHTQLFWQATTPAPPANGGGGSADTQYASPSTAKVLVQVIYNPGGRTLPEVMTRTSTTPPDAPYTEYSAYLVRAGKNPNLIYGGTGS